MVKVQQTLRDKSRLTTDLNTVFLYITCYLSSKEVIFIAKLLSSHFML